MSILDKKNILGRLNDLPNVVLELGCGPNKKISGAIGIDAIDYDCVDIVGDALGILENFPCGSVDEIYSYHFFEHLPDISAFLEMIAIVLKPGGKMEIVVPHFSNPYFYSDPTHKSFFGLYTFCYFATCTLFSRQIPTYNRDLKFVIENVYLVFKSSRPFYMRHGFKKLFGMLFNSCSFMKEFYEENLCYFFPCYEVRYKFVKIDR